MQRFTAPTAKFNVGLLCTFESTFVCETIRYYFALQTEQSFIANWRLCEDLTVTLSAFCGARKSSCGTYAIGVCKCARVWFIMLAYILYNVPTWSIASTRKHIVLCQYASNSRCHGQIFEATTYTHARTECVNTHRDINHIHRQIYIPH